MALKTGVYPGSFDPVTNGHLDIIGRTTGLLDKLIVAVAANTGKNPMFSVKERVAMLSEEINISVLQKNLIIEVVPFNNLLIDFVQSVNALIIIRGLRAVSDFEYEFQMAGMNSRLNPKIETVFLMASDRNQFISSRFVKEIGRLGGDIGHFVSPRVKKRLKAKFKNL
jgi:pantetheine-phosphate adenylyltransferase